MKTTKKVKEIKAKIQPKKNKIQQLELDLTEEKNARLRLLADFENYKKRMILEKEKWMSMANKTLLNEVIELKEDLLRAIDSKNNDSKDILEGCDLVLDKLNGILENQGLSEIKVSVNDDFDPKQMEAISSSPVKKKKQNNKIIHIVQKGYMNTITDSLFKPARVIIGKFS